MLKNRGGRKSGLIYSILTIIVLISISGGRETRGEKKVDNPPDDAALLITEDFLNERDRWIGEFVIVGVNKNEIKAKIMKVNYKRQKTNEGIRETKVMEIIVDGKEHHKVFSEDQALSEKGIFKHGWMEIKPGHHNIALRLYTDNPSFEDEEGKMYLCMDIRKEEFLNDIEIVPHGVYAIQVGIRILEGDCNRKGTRLFSPTANIRESINRYFQDPGVVTDPTDSKFSFRIKK